MASPTLHVRIVEKLPSGEHKLQVTLETERPSGTARMFNSVMLPAEITNVERLDDTAFVNKSADAWLAVRGGEWDKELVQDYLECILDS
jgi:hypothetical protein